ncbi:hypothetical protein KUCAC02_002549, partial [Chaenocephalus aceratus]
SDPDPNSALLQHEGLYQLFSLLAVFLLTHVEFLSDVKQLEVKGPTCNLFFHLHFTESHKQETPAGLLSQTAAILHDCREERELFVAISVWLREITQLPQDLFLKGAAAAKWDLNTTLSCCE